MKTVKMLGLMRSSTNLLELLLQANYHVKVLSNGGGWKHGLYRVPQELGRSAPTVCLVKEPYSWMVSMYRYRGRRKTRTFEDYLKAAELPVAWNCQVKHYADVCARVREAELVKAETVMFHPHAVCDRLAVAFGLRVKPGEFKTIPQRVGSNRRVGKKPFNLRFYRDARYMRVYSRRLLEYANRCLDHRLMARLGYAVRGAA